MAYTKIGKGRSTIKLKYALILNITVITKMNNVAVLIKYITAGPIYILTRETSSLMRLIKSPVLLRL